MFWRLVKTAIFSVAAPGMVGLLIPYSLRRPSEIHLFFPHGQAILGATLISVGVAIYLWCAWDFVSKGLGTPAPIDAPRVLVAKGLYRFTRNPMYVGVASMILGQSVYSGSARLFAYLACILTAFHLFVRFYEEPTLERLFGSEYDDYRQQVPRWLFRK